MRRDRTWETAGGWRLVTLQPCRVRLAHSVGQLTPSSLFLLQPHCTKYTARTRSAQTTLWQPPSSERLFEASAFFLLPFLLPAPVSLASVSVRLDFPSLGAIPISPVWSAPQRTTHKLSGKLVWSFPCRSTVRTLSAVCEWLGMTTVPDLSGALNNAGPCARGILGFQRRVLPDERCQMIQLNGPLINRHGYAAKRSNTNAEGSFPPFPLLVI